MEDLASGSWLMAMMTGLLRIVTPYTYYEHSNPAQQGGYRRGGNSGIVSFRSSL